MKHLILYAQAILIGCSAFTTSAGEVSGRLKVKAPEAPGSRSSAGKYTSKRYKFTQQIDYKRLTDFVVYLEGDFPHVPGRPATIIQRDVAFHPHILPIQQGTEVIWPNEDDIFHNVFSLSPGKPFNLDYYKTEKKIIRFDKPGRIDVFCAIHKDMHAIILVLDTPHFQRVEQGKPFTFKAIPAGKYQLHGWHERLPEKVIDCEVKADGVVNVDLTMGFDSLPEY